MPPTTGQLVANRYRVEAPLGQGSMATVWQVRDTVTGEALALKCIALQHGHAAARMAREGRLQQRLRHPHVVALHDVILLDSQPALLLELVRGPTLQAALADGPLPTARADALARGIIAGVAAAHAIGIVHRDLKPANVLLAREGDGYVPKISDFGLVKEEEPDSAGLTRTGAMLGTPQYMAPEQARNAKGVDARADLWALGCVLYELACGRRPFDGSDLYDVLRRVTEGRFAPPRTLRPDLAPAWERAILAALVVDPDRRIGSAEALARLWGAEALPADVWSASEDRVAPDPLRPTTAPGAGMGVDAAADTLDFATDPADPDAPTLSADELQWLGPAERTLLARLAAADRSFTIEVAEAWSDDLALDVLDAVHGLVERGWVLPASGSDSEDPEFDLHPDVRDEILARWGPASG